MKKKILIIGPHSDSWGGVATCLKEIEESEHMNNTYDFYHLTTWNNGKWIKCFINSLFKIKKLTSEADLIHVNLSKNGSTYRKLILSLYFKNKKYIVHMHNGRYGEFYDKCPTFLKNKIITFLEKAECIIFVSNYQKQETLNKIKINNKNIKVIYNGINISHNKPANKDYIQVLYFGSILKSRNIDEYLELANNLSNSNIKFVLAGNGSINGLNLNNVEYHGFVTEEEKEKLLMNSDIIYDHFSESFGLGLIEAMNHYACPLAYPDGSIKEIVGDNEYGLLFSNRIELSEKLQFLNKNKDILIKYQHKAYNRSLDFSNEKYLESFKVLYDEVINNE